MPSPFSVWLKKRSSLSRKVAAAALKRASLHKTFKLKSLFINSIDPNIKWQSTELQKQIWWSFKSIFPKPLNKLYMSNCTKLHHFSFRGRTSMAPALIMPPHHQELWLAWCPWSPHKSVCCNLHPKTLILWYQNLMKNYCWSAFKQNNSAALVQH